MSSGINLGAEKIRFSAGVQDATGFTLTVAAAGTPVAVGNALMLERANNSGGALTWDAATGVLTVAKQQAAGVYDLEALVGDAIGTGGGVAILRFQKAVGSGAFANVGNESRQTMAATAVRGGMGSVSAAGVSLALGDRVRLVADVGTNGHVVTLRALELKASKV